MAFFSSMQGDQNSCLISQDIKLFTLELVFANFIQHLIVLHYHIAAFNRHYFFPEILEFADIFSIFRNISCEDFFTFLHVVTT